MTFNDIINNSISDDISYLNVENFELDPSHDLVYYDYYNNIQTENFLVDNLSIEEIYLNNNGYKQLPFIIIPELENARFR